jgi:hypothetical protein
MAEPATDPSGTESQKHGAVPIDRVLVVRVNEDAPAKQEAAKKSDDKSSKMLEWIKAIGMPVVTLIATVFGGYYFTSLTKEREAYESNARQFAQAVVQREQSDAQIRRDLFGAVANRLLADGKGDDWGHKVLQLELLARNVSTSLNITPLFQEFARRVAQSPGLSNDQRAALQSRLDRTAANLAIKQIEGLLLRGNGGYATEQSLSLDGWENFLGKPFIDQNIRLSDFRWAKNVAFVDDKSPLRITVEVMDVSLERREVEVRLIMDFGVASARIFDRVFWVGRYNLPEVDNTLLPYGLRASVVMTDFFVPEAEKDREANSFVHFHLVVFPAENSNFKERQDYNDTLNDLLRSTGDPIMLKKLPQGR